MAVVCEGILLSILGLLLEHNHRSSISHTIALLALTETTNISFSSNRGRGVSPKQVSGPTAESIPHKFLTLTHIFFYPPLPQFSLPVNFLAYKCAKVWEREGEKKKEH